MLTHEARALLTRLALIKPFALQEPMLPTAALLPDASVAIDRFLVKGRRELRRLVRGYLDWLKAPDSQPASDEEAQRRFTILRLKFNVVLTQFDMFADVITQRSENETGVWLGGLDVVAADALALPGYYDAPPVICYLDRDIGAAIRRARTRCRAAARTRSRSSACRASAWSAPASRRRWCTRSGTRRRRCSTSSIRCGRVLKGPAARPRRRRWSGKCGSAGSPRSSPTSGRWRPSASPPRSA
jgi:hypothetical protein